MQVEIRKIKRHGVWWYSTEDILKNADIDPKASELYHNLLREKRGGLKVGTYSHFFGSGTDKAWIVDGRGKMELEGLIEEIKHK